MLGGHETGDTVDNINQDDGKDDHSQIYIQGLSIYSYV
jgi:hypothetical protein